MKKLIPIIITFILISCNEKTDIPEQTKQYDRASLTSSILNEPKPPEEEERNFLSFQGMVDLPPNQRVSIQPYFEGFIADIQVIEGSKVKKGDILFKLVNPEFIAIQEDYLVDKATVEYLTKVLGRTSALHAEKVMPDQDMEEMEMNHRVSKANLEAVEKTLRLMKLPVEDIRPENLFESINIQAPIDGYVDELLVTAGEFINRGRAALSIVNTDHVHLELNAFEKDLPYLTEGQAINFRIPEMNNQEYKAEIYLIGKSIDPQTRMVRVHAHLLNEELDLIPGMFVEARVDLLTGL